MSASLTQWHYVLVQHVPDRERAEGVNVGLVMTQDLGLGSHLQMLEQWDLDHLEGRLGAAVDVLRLERALKALYVRLARNAPRGYAELLRFFRAEGGVFVGTVPRSMRVENPEVEGRALFAKLVALRPHR